MANNTDLVDFQGLSAFKEEYLDVNFVDGSKEQNLSDAQKVRALNNLRGKAYAPSLHSGLGKVYLDKNNGVLTQAMINTANAAYVIMYDFTMSEDITVPANCVLDFDGGSISGGYTLTGDKTRIREGREKIFGTNVTLGGTWNIKEGYPEWFGCHANDESIDAAPIIQKFITAGIPVEFGIGGWYLSECLINATRVVIKGRNNGLSEVTTFYPYAAGQRFIMKFGGNADFSSVTNENYTQKWCKNFEISGIRFYVPEAKALVNADETGNYQNFAALCFDWSVQGYVDVQSEGYSPALFVANSWEIEFNKVMVYGCYTPSSGYAIYFGRCYTDVQASNISQVKFENIYGESIYGHFMGYKNANIGDILINNIEVEVNRAARPDKTYSSVNDARGFIFSNIRTAPKYYMIELGGSNVEIVHCDIQLGDTVVTVNDTSHIVGHVCTSNNLNIGTLTNGSNARGMIVGVRGSLGQLTINDVQGYNYNDGDYRTCLFTDIPQTDFAPHTYFEDSTNMATLNAGIYIHRSNVIENVDRIKEYGPGLMFNASNYSEVTSLIQYAKRIMLAGTDADNIERNVLYITNGITLDRKMKFKDASGLRISYIGKNYWYTGDAVTMTYYQNGLAVEAQSFGLPYSEKLNNHTVSLYTGDYDYCTITFNCIIAVESIEVIAASDESAIGDKVVMFPGEISNEVKTVMANYSKDDIYKQTALQYFFNKIGSIKDKLNHLILPIFAEDVNEAIYDLIAGSQFLPVSGVNGLEFNASTKRVHLSAATASGDWTGKCYALYDATDDFEGALTVVSATDGCSLNFYGAVVGLNDASLGYYQPSSTNNRKIVGAGVVSHNGANNYMRLGDSDISDKLTSYTELHSAWDRRPPIMGQSSPSDNTLGVRILVSSDQQLTSAEAKTLRDAVIALDNKYFA